MSKRKVLRIALYLLIITNVIFIWSMSLYTREESGAQSGNLVRILMFVFPFLKDLPSDVIEYVIRKLAHFSEFGLLGFLSASATWEYVSRKKSDLGFFGYAFPVLLACLFVASTDETIQIFTGRGPAVGDVMIDFSGAVCGFFILAAVRMLVILRKMK